MTIEPNKFPQKPPEPAKNPDTEPVTQAATDGLSAGGAGRTPATPLERKVTQEEGHRREAEKSGQDSGDRADRKRGDERAQQQASTAKGQDVSEQQLAEAALMGSPAEKKAAALRMAAGVMGSQLTEKSAGVASTKALEEEIRQMKFCQVVRQLKELREGGFHALASMTSQRLRRVDMPVQKALYERAQTLLRERLYETYNEAEAFHEFYKFQSENQFDSYEEFLAYAAKRPVKKPDQITLEGALKIANGLNMPEGNLDGARTLLTRAIEGKNIDTIRGLIGLGVDVEQLGHNEDTPLLWAVYGGSGGKDPIVQMLLEAGANLTSVGKWGYPPIVVAVQNKDLGMIDLLLQHGAKINQLDHEGRHVVALAADVGSIQIMNHLIGKKPTLTQDDKNRILICALRGESTACVQKALELGGNPNMVLDNDETLMDWVTQKNIKMPAPNLAKRREPLIELLKEWGANG